MQIEAEVSVMQPQAKRCLEPPEAGRGKAGFLLRAFRKSTALSAP